MPTSRLHTLYRSLGWMHTNLYREKCRAAELAKGVGGVRQVDRQLDVKQR